MRLSSTTRFATLFAGLFLAFSMIAVDHADARRGGSFGSRGMRTFQSAPPTRTAPQPTAPVERSMTPNTAPTNAARQTQISQQRPGFMNGFGGSMLRGLMLGGLIGLLLGHGFGGLAGMFGFLLQALLIGGAIWLAVRLFRSQPAGSREPAMAGASGRGDFAYRDASPRGGGNGRSFSIPNIGSSSQVPPQQAASQEISLQQDDLDTFQRRLTEVQEAFCREDHAALRRLVTPEMVSYLSEELADNAQKGVRNDVSDVQLHQADIAESWREGDSDYATAALQYSSRDVIVDRATGRVVEGNPDEPTETTELWTFVRQRGDDWKLSAIQET
ncbi:Tim44 domain-containing protein [Mesorhizobium sp. WSM2239]|uniref:Tim44 domain-containing protein n=2 Tax=unclassified Mesorhizobium TaxID=325217 RepID=A0AAU8DE47_9HYPH